jgi:hypothetical protein
VSKALIPGLVSLCGIVGAIGCNNLRTHLTRYGDSPSTKAAPPITNIPVFTLDEKAPRRYEVLGKVFAYDKINYIYAVYEERAMWEHLKGLATGLGADAIIGTHSSHRLAGVYGGETFQMWASGLAIRYRDGSLRPSIPHMISIKAIQRPAWYEGDDETWTQDVLAVRATARYLLEEAGYYAVFEESNRYLKPSLELQLELLAAEEMNLAILGRGSAAIRATFRSATDGKVARVVVKGGAVGTGGILWTLAADLRQGAMTEAVAQIVKELPVVTTWRSE